MLKIYFEMYISADIKSRFIKKDRRLSQKKEIKKILINLKDVIF